MTPYGLIESTLFVAVRNLVAPRPVSYPTAELKPEEQAEDGWFAVHNLRGLSEPVTLGSKGEDNHPGVLQVDVHTASTLGTGPNLSLCDMIATAFPAGASLGYTGGQVRVDSVSVGPGAIVDGFYRVPVSITYHARSVRRT